MGPKSTLKTTKSTKSCY